MRVVKTVSLLKANCAVAWPTLMCVKAHKDLLVALSRHIYWHSKTGTVRNS